MSILTVVAVTAATLALLLAVAWHRLHRVRAVLAHERLVRRLTEATHHRDLCALRTRLDRARSPSAVLTAADRELDRALALHIPTPRNPKEGDTP
jgi:hypothetical protein